MKTQIIIAMVILSMITLVSAVYYAGETIEIPTGFEIVNCSVTNSTYNLEGLNLSWVGETIIISTVPNYNPDNLTIDCWVIKYKEVVEKHYSTGGGGGCRFNKNFDWECTDWSECQDGTQTRECKERNNCGSIYGRPNITQSCDNSVLDIIIDEPGPLESVEQPKRKIWLWVLLGLGLIIAFLIALKIYYKKRASKK